jgi:glycogen debranching enzyme
MGAVIQFGREICGNLEAAESREWLVTNGIGGYASGTIAGGTTRRYHGLLTAALQPPVGRMHLVAALDEIVRCGGAEFALATHLWASGAVEPKGFQHIEGFRLDGTAAVWTYAPGAARLEKRVWMQQGTNTTYVQYTLLEGSAPIEMELKALVNYRDFHASTHAGDWRMRVDPVEHGVRVVAFDGAVPFYLKSAEADCEARHELFRRPRRPQFWMPKWRGHSTPLVKQKLLPHGERKTRRLPLRRPSGCSSLCLRRINS